MNHIVLFSGLGLYNRCCIFFNAFLSEASQLSMPEENPLSIRDFVQKKDLQKTRNEERKNSMRREDIRAIGNVLTEYTSFLPTQAVSSALVLFGALVS